MELDPKTLTAIFGDRPGPSGTVVSQNFVKWFGKSIAVDPVGSPLVVHHGSFAKFDSFNMKCSGDGAHFFTTDESHACTFGPSRSFFIKVENPMEITQDDLDLEWDKEHPDGEQDDRCLLPRDFVALFVDRAKAAGHDSLIVRDMGDREIETDMWLPFTPQQIKSTENAGAFDIHSPNFTDYHPVPGHVEGSPIAINFDRWFGASKVVDANNHPLVVYHGSGADLGASVKSGTFFTARVDVAEIYAKAPTRQTPDAGPNLTPVFLSLQNPYVFDAQAINDNLSHHVLGKRGHVSVVIEFLASIGYDGIILKNYDDLGGPQTQYVVFRPEQAKSAVGNCGAFDPNSSSLTDVQIDGYTQEPEDGELTHVARERMCA